MSFALRQHFKYFPLYDPWLVGVGVAEHTHGTYVLLTFMCFLCEMFDLLCREAKYEYNPACVLRVAAGKTCAVARPRGVGAQVTGESLVWHQTMDLVPVSK